MEPSEDAHAAGDPVAAKSARERARELFPSVLLTVLGIVQALALELLWEGRAERLEAWRAADALVTGWGLHLALLLGIIVLWVQFANTVMRIAWTPRIFDLVAPFVLGLLEFVLIEVMRPETIHWWFFLLALVSVISAGTNFLMFGRALREAERGDTQKGYVPIGVGILLLLIAGAATAATGPAGPAGLAGALLAIGMLAGQLWVFRFFWHRDILEDPES